MWAAPMHLWNHRPSILRGRSTAGHWLGAIWNFLQMLYELYELLACVAKSSSRFLKKLGFLTEPPRPTPHKAEQRESDTYQVSTCLVEEFSDLRCLCPCRERADILTRFSRLSLRLVDSVLPFTPINKCLPKARASGRLSAGLSPSSPPSLFRPAQRKRAPMECTHQCNPAPRAPCAESAQLGEIATASINKTDSCLFKML